MRRLISLFLCLGLWVGCGDTKEGPEDTQSDVSQDVPGSDVPGADVPGLDLGDDVPPPSCDPAGVTYQRDVRPLLVSHCFDCHSPIEGSVSAGSIYDWSLWSDPDPSDDLVQGISTWAALLVHDVQNRIMPPWPMGQGCREVDGSRALSQGDIDVFTAWQANSFCEGDEADYVDPGWSPPDTDHSDADITTASPEAWTLPETITEEDAFRCYKLDATFTEDTWVTAYATSPDTPMAHHALVYLISPADEAVVDALDAKFDGPGWGDCDSGVGVNGAVVSGWVPGADKVSYPQDSALLIPKGSVLVMQMHYSGVGATEEALKDNKDKTQIHFWTLPGGQAPSRRVVLKPWKNSDFQVPLGSTKLVSASGNAPEAGAKIFGIVPHMHNLGTAIRLEVAHPDGSTSCLARIGFDGQDKVCGEGDVQTCKMWDFGWQLIYQYTEADQVEIQAGDKVNIFCNYPYNDAWVAQVLGGDAPSAQDCTSGTDCESGTCDGGKCTNPDPLVWGEASFEEMCIAYLFYTVPHSEGSTFAQCGQACAGDADCLLDCILAYESKDCSVVDQLKACGGAECPAKAQALNQCLDDCDLGSALSCIRNTQTTAPCWDEYETFIGCTWAAISAGKCQAPSCQ